MPFAVAALLCIIFFVLATEPIPEVSVAEIHRRADEAHKNLASIFSPLP